ncbi:unnamed protein product [Brassica oleracea var. botrytis]
MVVMKNRWVDWKDVAEVTEGGGLIDGRETCGGDDYSSDNGYRSGDDYRIGGGGYKAIGGCGFGRNRDHGYREALCWWPW